MTSVHELLERRLADVPELAEIAPTLQAAGINLVVDLAMNDEIEFIKKFGWSVALRVAEWMRGNDIEFGPVPPELRHEPAQEPAGASSEILPLETFDLKDLPKLRALLRSSRAVCTFREEGTEDQCIAVQTILQVAACLFPEFWDEYATLMALAAMARCDPGTHPGFNSENLVAAVRVFEAYLDLRYGTG